MKIAIGADHGGFELKQQIKQSLKKAKHQVVDVGCTSPEPCDYPEFGFSAAEKVSKRKADRGIIVCKTGIGMAIIANKLPGVRAGVCASVKDAESARRHNDTNVLVLAATQTKGKKAAEIVKVWLKTKALKGRHARRVRQIKRLEKKVFKKR
ncbi:MAG: RpiB/LacA/LacB family sugar-phosphate isomerase [Candidatus Omnitrophica bacterium]|nr:RpiB/LacA/LacB family sugar-phosphate isomerase [Candidatus Omnitrophota bacterium]